MLISHFYSIFRQEPVHKTMKKISIRFGIKGAGMFPNAGIFVKSLPEDQAKLLVEGLVGLKSELIRMGNSDLASKLVAEYR
jgi:hypothetical protein